MVKTLLLYGLPLAVYALINNSIRTELSWPYYLVLLIAFLAFQLGRLRYPKDAVPLVAKLTQGAFYILAIIMIFRDKYADAGLVNIMIGVVIVFVVIELATAKPEKTNTLRT